jgi:hypothetical protein
VATVTHPCPSCRCDDWEPVSQPATSSKQAREKAKRAVADAVRDVKERRKKPLSDRTSHEQDTAGMETGGTP